MTKPQINITCEKCGYKWFTDSTRRRITCPSCNHSTFNPNWKCPKCNKHSEVVALGSDYYIHGCPTHREYDIIVYTKKDESE